MKASQAKRSQWIYVVLIMMLLALIGFSTLPLINSILDEQQRQTQTGNQESAMSQQQTQLETQAQGYEMVLQREPDNPVALRGLLEIRLQQNDLTRAIKPLERLAEINPEQVDYGILLAQAKQQIADYEGAAASYRRILAQQPANVKALQGMVNLLLAQKRPEQAIALLQDTIKTLSNNKPDDTTQLGIDLASIELMLGQVYVTQERYAEAIAVYDQAFTNHPQDFRPQLAKAMVLQQQGKDADAQPLFANAISLAPAKYKDQIKQIAMKSSSNGTKTDPLP